MVAMTKKKLSPEEKLANLMDELQKDQERWKYLDENGGSDPSWPDGINMNLVRNHIMFGIRQIFSLCEEMGKPLPNELLGDIPPKVNDNYMVNFSDRKRIDRLRCRFNLTDQKELDDVV